MASSSADGDEAPPSEDPGSPETAVLVPPAQSMRYPTLNMDGTAPLPSAPARGELVYAERTSAPVPSVGEGAPEPINLIRFCELLQVGSALRGLRHAGHAARRRCPRLEDIMRIDVHTVASACKHPLCLSSA
jgi:hypothetical protein